MSGTKFRLNEISGGTKFRSTTKILCLCYSMRRGIVVLLFLALLIIVAVNFSSRSYYSSNDPMLAQVRANFAKLNPRYAEIPLRTGDSAYTENKEVITLCLVNPDTGHYYDLNTIMYVSLHELSHVLTPEGQEEHGDTFKKKFADLLRKGAEIGIYNPRKPIPATYCKVHTN